MFKQSHMRQIYKNTIEFTFHLVNNLAWGPPWGVVNVPNETPLEKTDFPIASRLSIVVSFLLSGGSHVHFLLSVGILSGSNMCQPCVCYQSLWVHICLSAVIFGRRCFLRVFQHVCSVFVPIYCKKKPPWWWTSKALVYVKNRMLLWVIL